MVLINHYQYLYQNLTIIVCTYLLKLRCVVYVLTFYLELVSFIFSILWFTNSREFNDPNFGFSDSCTKKKALIKKVHSSTQCKIHRSLSRQVQFVENVNEIVWNILPTPQMAAILKTEPAVPLQLSGMYQKTRNESQLKPNLVSRAMPVRGLGWHWLWGNWIFPVLWLV
jgi:hypothetical protein